MAKAKRVLIVGGVAGGASCAARLRRMDERAEIVIFERGGDVSFANCGLPYYLGGVIRQRQLLLVSNAAQFHERFRVEVRTRCEVRAIDRAARTLETVNLASGTTQREGYDHLVLATGAAPLRPPVPGVDLPGVFTLRSLDDADRIHAHIESRKAQRAVVVGAGYVGLEMAENLVRRGLEVAVVERLPQVMPPFDPEMVVPLQNDIQMRGVDLHLSTALHAIERTSDDRLSAVTADQGRLPADLVILAVGVRPDVELARAAGLAFGALGGVQVDDQMRTSDPNVFAVGDGV